MDVTVFREQLDSLTRSIHENAKDKGWWEDFNDKDPRHHASILDLVHSEVSEATEAMRLHNPPSEKIPGFTSVEEELADAMIRILDYAGKEGLCLAEAMVAKHEYNLRREHRHGGKAF